MLSADKAWNGKEQNRIEHNRYMTCVVKIYSNSSSSNNSSTGSGINSNRTSTSRNISSSNDINRSMCFAFLYLHLVSAVEHVSYGKAL